ncbi:MAG: glycoside hydrolase family 31 protein [Chloroflexota bacterium]
MTANRPVRLRGHRAVGSEVIFDLGGPLLSIAAINDAVLRVRFSPTGRWAPRRSWAVVAGAGPAPPASVTAAGDGVVVSAACIEAEVDSDGRIAVREPRTGRELLVDAPGGGIDWEDDPPRSSWAHVMPADRRFYGFGERTGLLEKRGRRYTCWTTDEWQQQGPTTDVLYVAIPYYLALDPGGRAFGVFLDTTFRSAFDLTAIQDGRLSMEAETGELDWYVIAGPEPADVVERFTDLVGRPALPPRWAFGYHQARWSYGSAEEVLDIARKLRQHRIPADAVHLDIDHMDGYRVFTWDRDRFPDPARLTGELRDLGFRATVVVDAAVKRDETFDVYREGRRRDAFVRTSREADAPEVVGHVWAGESVLPDQVRPDVREWWGRLYGRYLEVGVAGFLNDMNEPALHDRPIREAGTRNTEPSPDTPFGPDDEPATHAEVRNVYALLENRAAVEGIVASRPGQRPFVVTRAGFAGTQRDAVVWTGDNASAWEHLEMSLTQLLNLGLSGVPVAGADIGGFFESCPPELLVRWTQLGAFYPFARNNSAEGTARQEPWAWGEPTTSRCRRAIELRYRLLPYLYTVAVEAVETGRPILRPMLFHYPADEIVSRVEDQALVGRDLLIAPVLRPGRLTREVRLPAGGWYDLRTSSWHAGGASVLVPAGLDEDIPAFVRAGSIIPMAPPTASTAEPLDPLTLHVYPTAEGLAEGTLYEDDGESTAYRDGMSARTRFEARRDHGGIRVSALRSGPYDPGPRRVRIVVHDMAADANVDASEAIDLHDAREWSTVVPSRSPRGS